MTKTLGTLTKVVTLAALAIAFAAPAAEAANALFGSTASTSQDTRGLDVKPAEVRGALHLAGYGRPLGPSCGPWGPKTLVGNTLCVSRTCHRANGSRYVQTQCPGGERGVSGSGR